MFDQDLYRTLTDILEEELVPAMGCTEPIAVAYCAALARKTLGALPERVELIVSPNIIKNVKSVVVPNTGGQRGLEVAAAAGIVAGDEDRELEALAHVTAEQVEAIVAYRATTPITVQAADGDLVFDIQVAAHAGGHTARARIVGFHTNVVYLEKDGVALRDLPCTEDADDADEGADRSALSLERIVAFADAVDIDDVRPVLDRQIAYNIAIAQAGLDGCWGAQIGRILLHSYGDTVHNRAKAWAAAGSDARMNGCELPVVINSGSGNQGLTASVPVIVYARDLGVSDEELYRALVVSNLVTIHLKTGIGRLSAYCGAVSAGCGAGAGITYLHGGRANEIAHTVVNAVAICSGVICDGAKASCAAKIAASVEAGLLGMQMQMCGSEFKGGDGIVQKGAENTIRNIGELARVGMRDTDRTIVGIMTRC